MDRLRVAVGMGGGQSLFCSVGISDYFDPAGGAGQAALLSQFLWTEGAAHLAGVCAAAGGGVSECAVVHRTERRGCDQDSALAGLHFLCAEPGARNAAAGAGADVVIGH